MHISNQRNRTLPFTVRFSNEIKIQILTIDKYNQDNVDGLIQWYDYLERLKDYISKPAVAWDYANRHTQFPNGTRFISDLGYNVGYSIKDDRHGGIYVYVFTMNFNLHEFGLKLPSNLNDNQNNKNLNCSKIMKNKKVIRLSESDLHNVIKESVQQVLMEMDSYGFNAALRNHSSLMNKVDPRTFAARANGVNAQGRIRNDDKNTMRIGGAYNWSERYGTPHSEMYGPNAPRITNTRKTRRTVQMDPKNYAVFDSTNVETPSYDGSGIPNENITTQCYRPSDNTKTTSNLNTRYKVLDKKQRYLPSNEGERVAKQMYDGSGKYFPNKGWQ